MSSTVFGDSLCRHRNFWRHESLEYPLLACNLGFYADVHFPETMRSTVPGILKPDDICIEAFLRDCERLFQNHAEINDDYPFVGSPQMFIPWMEAIMGCGIVATPTGFWAEPCVDDWNGWRSQGRVLDNPWVRKLLEIMQALVDQAKGRYPVSATLMRGPADIIAAMRGADKLPIDLLDSPDTMKRVIEDCTNAWIEVAKAQLALIPDSDDGYMDGDRGFRFWAPDRATWLQEDAMALLSPQLYHDFFLPADRRIATEFPAIGFHLHGSALWSVDDLLSIPEMDVIELNFEAARADIDATFAACRKIQSAKPLVVWRQYDADLWPWLDRVTRELSTKGLSMQITVANLEEARELTKRFYELKWQHS